jgi:hypothetical protein
MARAPVSRSQGREAIVLSPSILQDARLYALLQRVDGDLAEQARVSGCLRCGGVLHQARYPRKPRGGPAELDDAHSRRLSFCCAREGCRRRKTPPSVRFLGRRVYFGAVVVLVSALRDGLAPRRVRELRARLGVDRRTLRRWRQWWREAFVASRFWRVARGRWMPPVAEEALPGSLLERFAEPSPPVRLVAMLRFLAPISTG